MNEYRKEHYAVLDSNKKNKELTSCCCFIRHVIQAFCITLLLLVGNTRHVADAFSSSVFRRRSLFIRQASQVSPADLAKTNTASSDTEQFDNKSTTKVKTATQQQKYPNKKQYKKNNRWHTKIRIKKMFQTAQDLTRTGQWLEASRLLTEILQLDPKDAHSHLALARLESRREIASCSASSKEFYKGSHSLASSNSTASAPKLSWAMLLESDESCSKKIFLDYSTPTTSQTTKVTARSNREYTEAEKDHLFVLLGNNTKSKRNSSSSSSLSAIAVNNSPARAAFRRGTHHCPNSIHLWQAWAIHEQAMGNIEEARILFQVCCRKDYRNAHVCHAYGLLEFRSGNFRKARDLWECALEVHSTAALVCSLGELEVIDGHPIRARKLYQKNIPRLIRNERERTEVFLAMAWLEERHFSNADAAVECIQTALRASPDNSRAQVALARLEGRRASAERQQHSTSIKSVAFRNANKTSLSTIASDRRKDVLEHQQENWDSTALTRLRFAEACEKQSLRKTDDSGASVTAETTSDGRLFNAWANLELQEGRLKNARRILLQGIKRFPFDHSILQAMGNVEERLGNFARARDYYANSLRLELSAPAIVSYALLELRHPKGGKSSANITMVEKLFEEALLIDPRHGPTYNAYGTMKYRMLGNLDSARWIFESGVRARCNDPASVYHGYAKLELAAGNIRLARNILVEGLKDVQRQEGLKMETNWQRNRAVFLVHTLGMLELKSGQIVNAKDVFDHGIEHYGNSSQLLLGAALCAVKLGQQESARHLFERSITADKRHAHAWQAWGVMELRAGNLRVAKTLFENGLKNSPNHGPLWHSYASLESKTGNVSGARVLFAAGVAKCPNHIPLYHMWASLELRQENISSAKKLIGEALTRDKTQGAGWLIAARIEEALGNHGLDTLILKRGLECALDCPDLYRALAENLMKKGKIAEARDLLEKGLEVDPLNAPLYHSLAELEARVFNLEGLAKLNKRVAEIFNNNALVPSSASAGAWEMKLKRHSYKKKFSGSTVDASSFELPASLASTDPESVIASMSNFEDEIVGEIFSWSADDIINSAPSETNFKKGANGFR